jgi:hypothetical protein
MRAGFNLIEMQRGMQSLGKTERASVSRVAGAMADYYDQKIRSADPVMPGENLLAALDQCLDTLIQAGSPAAADASRACAALRYNLFPTADDFQPAPTHQLQERAA